MTKHPTAPLLDALGVEDLLPEEQEALLVDLGELIQKGTMVRLIERMDEKTRAEFNALLDTDPSEEDMEAFLESKVPDAAAAAAETVEELRNDILAVTGSGQD